MPWCPKCKNEYRDGITTCVDCGIPLVDSLSEATNEFNPIELALLKDKITSIRLSEYLKYSGITYVDIQADQTLHCYRVIVNEDEKKEAVKYYKAFLEVESSMPKEDISEYDEIEEAEYQDLEDLKVMLTEDELEDEPKASTKNSQTTYVKKEDAYKDLKSSASIFLTFSIIGFVFIALNATGVIQIISGTYSYSVMCVLFVALFFVGVNSIKRASAAKKSIGTENVMTKNINEYLDSLGNIADLDEPDWAGLNEEILYFNRTAKLKNLVIAKMGTLDDAYLDLIIEEYYDRKIQA